LLVRQIFAEVKEKIKMIRIRIDEQTVIILGYDECQINDGVAPNKVLSSGVINKGYKDSNEHEPICYVVITDFINLIEEDVPTDGKWNVSKNSA